MSRYLTVMSLAVGASVAASTALSGQEAPAPQSRPDATERTPEELADLANWVGIVKTPNVKDAQRTFNAGRILREDWPEARQAILDLLDNSDGSGACIPVCRAIAQNGAPRIEYLDALLRLLSDADSAVRNEAAEALAHFEEITVIPRLLEVIKDQAAGPTARVAAIDVLARIDDSYKIAGILMSLLDNLDGQIDATVFSALEKVSGENIDSTVDAWRAWWEKYKGFSRERWLERQLKLAKQQIARQDDRIAVFEERLSTAYQQQYLKAANGEKKDLLKNYLIDEEIVIRVLGVDIIQREIGDGGRPDDDVGAVLRSRLNDPFAEMRRGVLNILEHLRIPDDAPAVIELLAKEKDPAVRLEAIGTLGQLRHPDANGALIDELQRSTNPPHFKIAAAKSLGRLNAKGSASGNDIAPLTVALTGEYEQSSQQTEYRMELLFAMASIADPDFAPMLLDNLRQDQANIRRRCITGLRQMGDKSHLGQILPYAGDPDEFVRREVALAAEQLGSGDAGLNFLLGRLGPDAEPDDTVREILWRSFKRLWAALDVPEQLTWVKKLADLPDGQLELCKDLEGRLEAADQPPPHLLEVRILLAGQHETRSRFDEAAQYWGLAAEMRKQINDLTWKDASIRHFRALLHSGQYDPAIETAKRDLGSDIDYFTPRLCDEIIAMLDHDKQAGRGDQVAKLRDLVKSELSELSDGACQNRLAPFDEPEPQTATDEEAPPPTTPPDGGNLSVAPQNDG